MRNKALVVQALENLADYASDAILALQYDNPNNNHHLTANLKECEIGSNVYTFPTNKELTQILKKSKKSDKPGGTRTKQIIEIALSFLEYNETDEELQAAINEAFGESRQLAKLFPDLRGNKGWDIYDIDTEDDNNHHNWIDKVFFDNTFCSNDVRNSLIGHDNYSPNILVK